MIESFRCKETERIFHREYSRRLPTDIQKAAFRKLCMLNRSSSVEDLRVPPEIAWNLSREAERDSIAYESMSNGGAYDVEIVDYHKG